jgi:DNA-binding MarR family transcriptional regulator
MATAKKKTAPKKQVTKKPAPKPRSMPAKVAKPKPEATQAVTELKSSKKAQIHALLERPEGATIEEMAKLTEWKNHTVRGFLSMLKKAGFILTSERMQNERRYWIRSVS